VVVIEKTGVIGSLDLPPEKAEHTQEREIETEMCYLFQVV